MVVQVHEHQVEAGKHKRLEKLADPPTDGRTRVQEEGYVGAQGAGKRPERAAVQHLAPGFYENPRARSQSHGGVGASSAQPRPNGDLFLNNHLPVEGPSR